MNNLSIIALTHQNIGIKALGKFHIAEDKWGQRLLPVKTSLGLQEFMFLSTCNRVEITLRTKQKVNEVFFKQILEKLYPNWSVDELNWGTSKAEIYRGHQAVYHLNRVAASLESLCESDFRRFRKDQYPNG